MHDKDRDIPYATMAVVVGLLASALFFLAQYNLQLFRRTETIVARGGSRSADKGPPNRASESQRKSPIRLRNALMPAPPAQHGLHFEMHFLPGEQGAAFKFNLYDHGCGVVVGDYDGDGHDDVYFLNQLGANGLFRNRGDGLFEDVTEKMGVGLADRICVGGSFADYDNDGDQDLFVTSTRGGNVLFRNEDRQRFVDVTEEAGVRHVGHSQTPVFFDYNNDGRLDLFVVQTAAWTTDEFDAEQKYFVGQGGPSGFDEIMTARREHNLLYRNEGEGRFRDVTSEAGMEGRGWAGDAAVFDYDEDGWIDVLVTSMFGRAQLYRNLGTGRFEDVTLKTLGRTPFGAIGAKAFDYDNDGHLDLYIVDLHSDMWLGIDDNQHSERLAKKYVRTRFDSRFGPHAKELAQSQLTDEQFEALLDFRHEDVLFGNAFYRNRGDGTFEEVSGAAQLENFWPRGIATGDFDNDGDVDAVVTSGMGFPYFYWGNYLLINDGHRSFVDRATEWGFEPPPAGVFPNNLNGGTRTVRSSRGVATADFDGDGKLEIVTNNFNHEPYYFGNSSQFRDYVALSLRGTRSNRDAIGAVVRIRLGDQTLVRQVETSGGYLSQSSKCLHFGLGSSRWDGTLEIRWPCGVTETVRGLKRNKRIEIVERESDGAGAT